jgi:hypothetical protein
MGTLYQQQSKNIYNVKHLIIPYFRANWRREKKEVAIKEFDAKDDFDKECGIIERYMYIYMYMCKYIYIHRCLPKALQGTVQRVLFG